MFKKVICLSITIASLLLGGCAGRDFGRPDSAELRVGQSTYSRVIAKMGEPRNTGEVIKNGETIKTITYAYATTGGEPLQAGVIPARAMAYYFHRDTLVGQEFLSSFKSDNSNFDEPRVARIEKGKATRNEVIQALGRPTATFKPPVVKETHGEAIGYTYQTTSGNVYTGLKQFRKTLRVTFDNADKVLDAEYSAIGSK